MEKFEKEKIIPDVVDILPKQILEVIYKLIKFLWSTSSLFISY